MIAARDATTRTIKVMVALLPKVGQTQDPYGYAAGNPVGNTDPSGMDPSEWPVNGYSCAQRFKWCDMFLKTNGTNGLGIEVDWASVRLRISPGAESSLVTYTAQRKVHGAWFSRAGQRQIYREQRAV